MSTHGSEPWRKAREDDPPHASNASESAFYRFLQQALTLGAKRLRPSVLPQFIGFLVYVALVVFLASGLLLNHPQVTAAAIVMLMLVGLVAILLLLDLGRKVHAITSNVILLLVVASFLAISGYVVVRLLAEDSIATLKQKCMGGQHLPAQI